MKFSHNRHTFRVKLKHRYVADRRDQQTQTECTKIAIRQIGNLEIKLMTIDVDHVTLG